MDEPRTNRAIGRIMLVDKDTCVLQMLEMLLGEDFQVVTARSAEQGLALLSVEEPFHIVLSDFSLAGLNGFKFLLRVKEMCPSTVRILMAGGCGNELDVTTAISEGHINRIVLKPFFVNTLKEQLKNDLESVL